jgi:hypothetical protein
LEVVVWWLSVQSGQYRDGFACMHSTRLRLPKDDADASKHVGIVTIYKILLINSRIGCAHVGLDTNCTKCTVRNTKQNELYKHGTPLGVM